MKSTVRTALCAIALMSALWAVAASAASAHEYVIEGQPLTSPAPYAGSRERTQLLEMRGELLGIKVDLECHRVAVSGDLESGGKSTATVAFSACTITRPTGCAIAEPQEVHPSGQLLSSNEDELNPFNDEFQITGCAIKGRYSFTGHLDCELETPELEAVEHYLACPEEKSDMRFGGEPAHFFIANVPLKLASGQKWSVR